MNVAERYQAFVEQLGEVIDLRRAAAVLQWDQEVLMPSKGAEARGRQLSTLAALEHRMFTADVMRGHLEELQAKLAFLSEEQQAVVRETAHDLDRATRIPESLVQRLAEAQSRAYHVWVDARRQSDFSLFLPHLEVLVGLSQEKADRLGFSESPYDPLLDEYERGMTAAALRTLFDSLASRQSDLVAKIMESPNQPETGWLDQHWEEGAQLRLTESILKDMGYDFEAGRQDLAVHPFTTTFDVQDVRVTTRIDPRDFISAVSSSIHEGGHALYEQGFPRHLSRTTLADAPSLGMHESQSRLWENMIGRSQPFWRGMTPRLREFFPGQLENVAAQDIFRAANRVEPSLIRVDADECTYNLHVIVRFEIEVALLEGSIKPEHVPELWNAKMRVYLGVDVPNDAQGCLQDIHWSHGSFGYFPTYALGNLYAAQLMERIEQDISGLWGMVDRREFAPLLDWLRHNVHIHGRAKTAADVLRSATGQEPTAEPYLRYLEKKYSALYTL